MKFQSRAYLCAVLAFATPGVAVAQSAAPAKASSGLTVAISKVSLLQKQVSVQFTLTNNSKGRAYFLNARGDRRESGFFSSGEQMNQPPHLNGMNFCEDNLEHCVAPLFSKDLTRFSYVEPGDSTAFAMTWIALSTVSDKDTFSFTVPLVVRFSPENGDEEHAGPPKGVQFNFPGVRLDRDN